MKIHYNSLLAKIFLKHSFYAITFGKHVYVKGKTLSSKDMKHEEIHVNQYKKYGFFGFLWKYWRYHRKYGYWNNPLEIEARITE